MIENWDKLYKNEYSKLLRLCQMYSSCKSEAEDLLHDAFIIAFEKKETFKGIGKEEAWLRKIVLNHALMQFRKKIHKQEFIEDEINYKIEALSFEPQNKEHPNELKTLLSYINILPAHHKTVFNLYVFENLKHKEIARLLNISIGTSKSHLARARKQLKESILINNKKKSKRRLFFIPVSFIKPDHILRKHLHTYYSPNTNTVSEKSLIKRFNTQISTFGKISIFTFSTIVIAITTITFNSSNKTHNYDTFSTKDTISILTESSNDTVEPASLNNKFIFPEEKSATILRKSIIKENELKKDTNMSLLKLASIASLLSVNTSQQILAQSSFNKSEIEIKKIDEYDVYKQGWAMIHNKKLKGIVDTNLNVIIPLEYKFIGEFFYNKGTWALVQKDRKYGFIDTLGKLVVPTVYDKLDEFNAHQEDWLLVSQNKKYGFINRKGEEVVPCRYDQIYDFDVLRTGWALVKKGRFYGAINNLGQEVIPTKYKNISEFGIYKDDWAKVTYKRKHGFIDTTGKLVVPPIYDFIGEFGELHDKWSLVTRDKQKYFLTKEGKEISASNN